MTRLADLAAVDDSLARRVQPERDTGCWIWTGAKSGPTKGSAYKIGYGVVHRGGRKQGAHKAVWEALNGPVPDGLELDHLCRNHFCVNPKHLDPVPHRENIMRSPVAIMANHARTTHCPQGHPYDEKNTWVRPATATRGPRRECRTCNRESARRHRTTKPEQYRATRRAWEERNRDKLREQARIKNARYRAAKRAAKSEEQS